MYGGRLEETRNKCVSFVTYIYIYIYKTARNYYSDVVYTRVGRRHTHIHTGERIEKFFLEQKPLYVCVYIYVRATFGKGKDEYLLKVLDYDVALFSAIYIYIYESTISIRRPRRSYIIIIITGRRTTRA